MPLIDIPEKSPAENVAESLLKGLNEQLEMRVGAHRRFYSDFWDTDTATPDEILAALGTDAYIVLAAASESVDHIGRLAAIVGKTVGDFLPDDQWMPRRAFIPHPDGTVTLAPPTEGFIVEG